MELKKLNAGKAAGPDKVCPRLLKVCADQLAEPLQELFNLSLQSGRVPVLWKTSCLVPVPKTGRPAVLNDYRPVALTSHVMKTLERLFLRHLRPLTEHEVDPLQFGYPLPASPGLLLPGRAGKSSENYVLRLFELLQHHPASLTYREARKDRGGSLLHILDYGLPDRMAAVCQTGELCL